jgi:hypothetical protein
MITNVDYLIQKYADAVEKINNAKGDKDYRNYWNGIKDAYHNILNEGFKDWTAPGGIGYYVFFEQMTYNEALDQVVKERQLEQVKRGY